MDELLVGELGVVLGRLSRSHSDPELVDTPEKGYEALSSLDHIEIAMCKSVSHSPLMLSTVSPNDGGLA